MFPQMLVHSGKLAAGYAAFVRRPVSLLYGGSGAAFGGCYGAEAPVEANSRFVLLCSLRSQSEKASVPRNQVSR